MAVLKASAILAIANLAAAQSSTVVSVFFPGADGQTLLASVIESDASQTTMAVECPPGADANDCGFPDPITVTVGPSTFHAEETFESLSVELDCVVTGTTEAVCQETYVGPAADLETDISVLTQTETSLATDLTTVATTTTLGASEVAFIPITITAGLDGSGNSTTHGSTSSGSRTTGGSSTSHTGTSSQTASGPVAENTNGAIARDAQLLGMTALGAGLVGLSMMFL